MRKPIVVGLLVLGLLGPTAPAKATVYTVPVPSGGIDNRLLARFFASVPDGTSAIPTVVEFPADAVYDIRRSLLLESRSYLQIDGNAATIKAVTTGRRNRANLKLSADTNITITDLIVVGANPDAGLAKDASDRDYEGQSGFLIKSASSNILLDNVTATDVWGDFVTVHGCDTYVTVQNSHFARNGRQGITVGCGSHVLITNNVITDIRQATFDLEPGSSSWVVDDIQITNNTVGPYNFTFLSAASYGPVTNVTLSGNTVIGTLRTIVQAKGSHRYGPFEFLSNTASQKWNRRGAALRFANVDGVEVAYNDQPVNFDKGTFFNCSNCTGVNEHDNVTS